MDFPPSKGYLINSIMRAGKIPKIKIINLYRIIFLVLHIITTDYQISGRSIVLIHRLLLHRVIIYLILNNILFKYYWLKGKARLKPATAGV